jgi:hypothetical protein
MYELPDHPQPSGPLEAFEMYGFGDIFQNSVQTELDRQTQTENSILIRGPLNPDLILDLWISLQYFVNNSRDFRVCQIGKTKDYLGRHIKPKTQIKAIISGLLPADEQKLLCYNEDGYIINVKGPLKDQKHFSLSLASDPLMVLPGCLKYQNDFSFSTYDVVGGRLSFEREGNFDVHINGPSKDPVVRDLLLLSEAVKEYCLRKVSS